jgi:WD40 repeat protein
VATCAFDKTLTLTLTLTLTQILTLTLLGMFVAACAFDKTINLFDFFSGDLVAQVTGHSELITAVRFSPDGYGTLSPTGIILFPI